MRKMTPASRPPSSHLSTHQSRRGQQKIAQEEEEVKGHLEQPVHASLLRYQMFC